MIRVRHGQPVEIDVSVTHHGPIIIGDPAQGYALALRYTALAEPNASFDALLPMLRAPGADEFEEALRPWVDPCNNILFADVHGQIAYRTRGQVPIRSRANAWLPVPGWTTAHDWQGMIPFTDMPRLRNPEAGYMVTANNRIADETYQHYLALHYEPGFRARRIRDRLRPLTAASGSDMAAIQADRVSIPAQAFVAMLGRVEVVDTFSPQARSFLQQWDGTMAPDSVAATIYAVCRDELMRLVMEPVLGPLAPEALGGGLYGTLMPLGQLRERLLNMMQADDRTLLPAGETWALIAGAGPVPDGGVVTTSVGRRSAAMAVGTTASHHASAPTCVRVPGVGRAAKPARSCDRRRRGHRASGIDQRSGRLHRGWHGGDAFRLRSERLAA